MEHKNDDCGKITLETVNKDEGENITLLDIPNSVEGEITDPERKSFQPKLTKTFNIKNFLVVLLLHFVPTWCIMWAFPRFDAVGLVANKM